MLEQLLEKLHSEHGVIQIGLLAQSLLEVAQQTEGIGSVSLFGKLKDTLKLDAQAREIQAVQACAQTRIA